MAAIACKVRCQDRREMSFPHSRSGKHLFTNCEWLVNDCVHEQESSSALVFIVVEFENASEPVSGWASWLVRKKKHEGQAQAPHKDSYYVGASNHPPIDQYIEKLSPCKWSQRWSSIHPFVSSTPTRLRRMAFGHTRRQTPGAVLHLDKVMNCLQWTKSLQEVSPKTPTAKASH